MWRTLIAVALLSLTCLAGCDNGTAPTPSAKPVTSVPRSNWLGLPSAVNQVVHLLHEGTGWILNKSQVDVSKVGGVRKGAKADSHLADFQVKVTKGDQSFETTIRDVPCDGDGIPTEEAVTKLREAVENIKAKIRRLQN